VNDLLNINDYEKEARKRLSKMVYDYYAGGALDEHTLSANKNDLKDIRLFYRVLRGIENRDLQISILGQKFNYPIGASPSAMQKMAHPDGEVGVAKVAAELGIPYTLSTLSNYSIEDVGACFKSSPTKPWFQLYIHTDRGLTLDLVKRAEESGFTALVLTADAPVPGIRERDKYNKFLIPENLKFGTLEKSVSTIENMNLVQYVSVPRGRGIFT
jgi:isopentenyl diphosphate isomerase/L-lactate dehydrogenase-like FMN-dependent dehydrogenase